MPCYDGMPVQTELEKRISDSLRVFTYALKETGRPIPPIIEQANKSYGYVNDRRIEPMFCEFMSNLRDNEPDVYNTLLTTNEYPNQEIRKWWYAHQAQDAVMSGQANEYPEAVADLRVAALKRMDRVDAALLGLLDEWDKAHNFNQPETA